MEGSGRDLFSRHLPAGTIRNQANAGSPFLPWPLEYNVACRAVNTQLCNQTGAASTQRLSKHVPTAADTHTIIEVLLETVFSNR
jgi:hypothetical protein